MKYMTRLGIDSTTAALLDYKKAVRPGDLPLPALAPSKARIAISQHYLAFH
jgi:hypothetical protein